MASGRYRRARRRSSRWRPAVVRGACRAVSRIPTTSRRQEQGLTRIARRSGALLVHLARLRRPRPVACTSRCGATASPRGRRRCSRVSRRRCSRCHRVVRRTRLARCADPDGRRDRHSPAWRSRSDRRCRDTRCSTGGCRCCRACAGRPRFGFLALVAVAVLAGFGVAALGARAGGRGAGGRRVVALLLIIVNAKRCGRRSSIVPSTGIPRVYHVAARRVRPRGRRSSPSSTPATMFRNAPYVLNSTAHWKPLVNGYSGFVPPSYVGHADALRAFPDDRARQQLRALGVTHVVVHLDAYGDRASGDERRPRRRAMAGAGRDRRIDPRLRAALAARGSLLRRLNDYGPGLGAWRTASRPRLSRTTCGSPRLCRGCAGRSSASPGTGCHRRTRRRAGPAVGGPLRGPVVAGVVAGQRDVHSTELLHEVREVAGADADVHVRLA